MAENTKRTKELTSTQEGIIAGLVLLFFGLLYWYLNPWQDEQQSMPNLTEQTATGNIQRHSLADTSPTQATSTTETSTDTSQTQTAAIQTANNPATATTVTSPQPQTTTQAPPSSSATAPTAASATSNTAMSGTAAEPVLTAAALAESAMPANPTPATATTATKPEPAQPTTTNMVNKLELAPGSPEAKLQSYLENKTLETPVNMDGINFEAKTAKLTKESDAAVLLLAALLAQYPEANLLITSYTTDTGNKNQNSDELSLIRAQTLGENLVKAGVNGKRITIMGMGKRPSPDPTSVASNKSQHIEISVIQ